MGELKIYEKVKVHFDEIKKIFLSELEGAIKAGDGIERICVLFDDMISPTLLNLLLHEEEFRKLNSEFIAKIAEMDEAIKRAEDSTREGEDWKK